MKDIENLQVEELKKCLFSIKNEANNIAIPMYLKVMFTEDELYSSIIKESDIKVAVNDRESTKPVSTANITVMKAEKPKYGRSNDGWKEGEPGLV